MTLLDTRPTTARLIPAGDRRSLAAHRALHGPIPAPRQWTPARRHAFLAELERSGLTGRGGATFPSHRKARAVLSTGTRPVLAVNAMEGEPASAKDRLLLQHAPHLVLDGAEVLAQALGATRVVVCIPEDREAAAAAVAHALAERGAGVPVEIARPAGRYVAGEESALVAAIAGGAGVPAFRPDKSVPLSIGRRPAVVHNVETLAHVGLVARSGAEWFREVGTAEAPGTCLVTVSGGVDHPGVFEVEVGTPVADVVAQAWPSGGVAAVLVGGYGGSWLAAGELEVPYAPADLRALGAAMGAGVLVVLPARACGLRETARIARFMAAESAGRCGPCLFGLPAVAGDLDALAAGTGDGALLERLRRRCGEISGRGACRHPDGVVRLVASALRVFAADVDAHSRHLPCAGSDRPTVLQLPAAASGR